MDIQFIFDEYSCATYVAEYVNKSERVFSFLHRELIELRDKYPDMDYELCMKELGKCTLNNVEMCTQDAAWFLLRLPMSESSRKVVYIPTQHSSEKFRSRKTKKQMDDSTDWKTSIIQFYERRPEQLKDMCLAEFLADYDPIRKPCSPQKDNDDDSEENSIEETQDTSNKEDQEDSDDNNEEVVSVQDRRYRKRVRPSPPGKPSLVSDNDFIPDVVTIRWPKPINDGGSPITGYLVEHRRTGAPHWIRSSPTLVPQTELSITSLEPGWRYQFRVRAENAVGLSEPGELSEPLTSTLERSAIIPPLFTQELKDTVAVENEKVEFVLHFLGQPTPKICWYKDGFEIFSSRRTRIITENGRSTLTIHQSALADEGEIKCTATNRAGHASTKSKLTLEAPPTIRLPRQYEEGLLFEIGEMMRLKVSVAGRPTPLLFWYHNGEPLQNSDRYEMTYRERSSILKIDEARRSDRGEYQVKAVNKLGEDTASFLVTVTDKPAPPGKARVVMTLGRSVTLSWLTPQDDGGCKIGNYIIEYYRVGWNVWLKAATSRQLSTILGDLIEGSEYKFRVKAESPYGVSDPSEETETVFIPDPKRGILTPEERSRSQPRDVIEQVLTPVATRRRNKSRSLSNSRAQTPQPILGLSHPDERAPVRPQRTKVKTPQTSPRTKRKEIKTTINSGIFDRDSMAREMAYGSPEIKVKKAELEPPQSDYLLSYSSSSDKSDRSVRSRSPSPFVEKPRTQERRISIYSIENIEHPPPPPPPKEPTPPRFTYEEIPVTVQRRLSRQHSDNITGSSEFMLVLYPDGNEKDHKKEDIYSFDFGDELIPPPLSLSAPELGTEPPPIDCLRHAISSTELLHERAMLRFYQAMQDEEEEEEEAIAQKRKQSVIPKIQINSEDDIFGLGDFSTLRRRKSLSAVGKKRALWAQRRHSLRGNNDIMEVVEEKLGKSSNLSKISLSRQRSMEREDTLTEEAQSSHQQEQQPNIEQHKIETLPKRNESYEEEYEESLSESGEESESEDERLFEQDVPPLPMYIREEEETYNPRMKTPIQGTKKNQNSHNSEEPFEILTVRKEPPSPDFKPKPILKKAEIDEVYNRAGRRQQVKEKQTARTRTHSPMPPFNRSTSLVSGKQSPADRKRSSSIAAAKFEEVTTEEEEGEEEPEPAKISEERKNSLLAKLKPEFTNPKRERSTSLTMETRDNKSRERSVSLTSESLRINNTAQDEDPSIRNISTAAALSGIAAASIVIPKELLKRKAEEETKVAIDHYGDILRNYGAQKRNVKRESEESNTDNASESDKVNVEEVETTHAHKMNGNLIENKNQVLQKTPSIQASKSSLQTALSVQKKGQGLQKVPSDEYEPTLEEIMSAEPSGITYVSRKPKREQINQIPVQQITDPRDPQMSQMKEDNPKNPHNPQSARAESPKQFRKPEKINPGETQTMHIKEGNPKNPHTPQPSRTDSPKEFRTPENIKSTSSSRSSSRSRKSKRSSSNSPHRLANRPIMKSMKYMKNSPSPEKHESKRKSSSPEKHKSKRQSSPEMHHPKRKSPSPVPQPKRHPKMREIMTQTSIGLELNTKENVERQELLVAQAEIKVRSTVDYITDLAMFAVACWLYLHKQELLALPVLLFMVYRQLAAEIYRWIPKWILRRLKRKKKKKHQ